MKKLFSLAAALLFGLSAMAQSPALPADAIPATVLDASDVDSVLYASTNEVHNGYLYTTYSMDTMRIEMKSTKVQWVKGPKNDGGGSGSAIFPVNYDAETYFGFQSNMVRYAGINSARYYGIRVTNCAEVAALTRSNSTKDGKCLFLYAFEKQADNSWLYIKGVDNVYGKDTAYVISVDELNPAKEYIILLTSGTSSNNHVYQVRFASPASAITTKYTVTYMDGETILGTEKVVAGETATKASTYETKAHCTFNGWYNDAALTSAADLTAAITADKTFYGKWTAEAMTTFSTSINIEQLVLDNGKAYDIAGALTAAHINYANINDLDSLNDSKDARNEPYLGLKLKTAGAYVEVGLHAGDIVRVKFGNVAADIKVNGETVAKATIHNVATGYEYTATADEYVRFETTTGGTVVVKQIMINEAIAEVVLPEATPTSLDEVAAEKAQKVMINGQLYIIKNGVRYNALGSVVE